MLTFFLNVGAAIIFFFDYRRAGIEKRVDYATNQTHD
jgi:hypothetical protein